MNSELEGNSETIKSGLTTTEMLQKLDILKHIALFKLFLYRDGCYKHLNIS